MKTYRIRLVSQTNIILLVFSLLAILFILIATVNLKPVKIPFLVCFFLLAIFIWKKFVTGITIWRLTEDGIHINWEKRFYRAKTQDYYFNWSEITKIWKGLDPNYYNLKFEFKSGEIITFFHNGANDDFKSMLSSLYSMWDEKNRGQKIKPLA